MCNMAVAILSSSLTLEYHEISKTGTDTRSIYRVGVLHSTESCSVSLAKGGTANRRATSYVGSMNISMNSSSVVGWFSKSITHTQGGLCV